MGHLGLALPLIALLLCVSLETTVAVLYNAATARALLEFKAAVGAAGAGTPGYWGASWRANAACSTWTGTTCDSAGNLLTLTLQSKRLEGAIPASFYTITTLTRLDLRGNRLYGTVNRKLAAINPNLIYLDLSSNFFTGRFPDIWTGPSLIPDGGFPYLVRLRGTPIYINISNTFFTGYQTVFSDNPNFKYQGTLYPYNCIGIQTLGDSNNTCLTPVGGFNTQTDPGACGVSQPVAGYTPPRYLREECYSWCGSKTGLGVCRSRQGAACRPVFASATSNVVTDKSCVYAPDPVTPALTPAAVRIVAAEAVALTTMVTALGNPASLLTYKTPGSRPCTTFPRLVCNSLGNIISLNLSGLALTTAIPRVITSFSLLRRLYLNKNSFTGSFSLNLTLLPQLVVLDVSQNQLYGPPPTNFVQLPTYLNISSNFFSGDPTVRTAGGDVYCPNPGKIFAALNCLTPSSNSPCPGEEQRTVAQCQAVCGIVARPNKWAPFVGPCANGALGNCGRGKRVGTWVCSKGSVAPAPPAPTRDPIYSSQLLYFAQFYIQYGTPAAVFATWQKGTPCNRWSGLTCDAVGNLIAVDLSNRGLMGPFPSPYVFSDLLWTSLSFPGYSSTVRYLDFSRNKLYGLLDSQLAGVTNTDYLDISNNFLTGSIPRSIQNSFKYLDISNNYFYGRPNILAVDGSSPACAGTDFRGSFAGNCFDLPATANCSVAAVQKPVATCRAFCKGASSTIRGGVCAGVAHASCKPTKVGFACSR